MRERGRSKNTYSVGSLPVRGPSPPKGRRVKPLTVKDLEVGISEEELARIIDGKKMTISDQVKMLNQACSLFLDLLTSIPEEHKVGVDGELLLDSTTALMYAVPFSDRDEVWENIMAEEEDDGADRTEEGQPDEGV